MQEKDGTGSRNFGEKEGRLEVTAIILHYSCSAFAS